MIFPIDPQPLYTLAASIACPAHPPAVVTVAFVNDAPVFDVSKSSKQLTDQKVDTVVAHAAHEVFTTGGITAGKIKAGFNVGYHHVQNMQTGELCFWVEKIEAQVIYSPTVFIASEYGPNSCKYGVITQHEMRHVSTDVITTQAYIAPLRSALQQSVASVGNVIAASMGDAKARENTVTGAIGASVNVIMEQLESVRKGRQQQIDTRAEYLRLSGLCR